MEAAFKDINTVEDLFKDLEANKHLESVRPLASYRDALMREGFTRRESMRLTEAYSKFMFDMMMEEILQRNREEELAALDGEEEDKFELDDSDPDEYAT